MKQRALGSQGFAVSSIGLGCMGMSKMYGYGDNDDASSILTIQKAVEKGITLLDTANVYGNGHNEELIGKALKEIQQPVSIATKAGLIDNQGKDLSIKRVNGRPEYLRAELEKSLKRLGKETVDLYYLHRIDPDVPIEESIGEMSRFIEEGKVRYLGISEASVATIEKAHKTHPLTTVQTEYSLWSRGVESEIIPFLKKSGIGFVAYSPLGRGFFADDFSESDDKKGLRQLLGQFLPRFQGENYQHNLELFNRLSAISKELNITSSQLALAWLLAKEEMIVPIPGSKSLNHIEENIAAVDIKLQDTIVQELNEIFSSQNIQGERYPEMLMGELEI